MPRKYWSLFAMWIYICCSFVAGAELRIAPSSPDGIFEPGQTICWNVKVEGVDVTAASYALKKGGLTEIGSGVVQLSEGKGKIEATLDEPGWLLVEVNVRPPTGKRLSGLGGAFVSPTRIAPALPRPKDFDAFWKAKLEELTAVPANPVLEPGDSANADIEYFKITMDNIRGSHIRGQLARPKQGSKFPAMFIVQWAGVYPLHKDWVLSRAAEGWLVLNINAHDLPIDKPQEFYSTQRTGTLKNYPAIGNDDRETSYFLRMYLSCYRGAQYLADRNDWDGRTLVVTGGSQGGLQSIVTAGMHPQITGVMANVPAGCDLNGPEAGRIPGWPMWYFQTEGKDASKVRGASEYYDVVNFASRVTCPVLIGAGLIDRTCPPPGVFAAFNQLSSKQKEIVVMPIAEHGERRGSHAPYRDRFDVWNKALVHGEQPQVDSLNTTKTAAGHPFACGAYSDGKALIISTDGEVEWEHPAAACNDLWVLPSGNLLFSTGHGVKEVNRQKEVLFSYESNSEIYACQRLADGNTFIAECNAGRLIEVDSEGKTVKEIRLLPEGQDGGHVYIRNARKLNNGHYLVTHYGAGVVREYDADGLRVREIPAPSGPHSAIRLPNGNTLISCGDREHNPPEVFEVDSTGKTVWRVTNDDLPGIELAFMSGLQRLPNGNTVMTNWLGHGRLGTAPHVIEVTRDKKVVWTFSNHDIAKTIATIQLLDVVGDATRGEILH